MKALVLPDKLFFRIGETARILGIKPHVIRYWETEFRSIRPAKSRSGQRVYSRRDVEVLVPGSPDFEEIDRIIFAELAAGKFTDGNRRRCLAAAEGLLAAGAEGIVMGCTELPLLFGPEHLDAPVIDTLAVHAAAAVREALAGD